MPMCGFEPRISGVRSDRFTNCATTTALTSKNLNQYSTVTECYLQSPNSAQTLELILMRGPKFFISAQMLVVLCCTCLSRIHDRDIKRIQSLSYLTLLGSSCSKAHDQELSGSILAECRSLYTFLLIRPHRCLAKGKKY